MTRKESPISNRSMLLSFTRRRHYAHRSGACMQYLLSIYYLVAMATHVITTRNKMADSKEVDVLKDRGITHKQGHVTIEKVHTLSFFVFSNFFVCLLFRILRLNVTCIA